MDIGIVIRLVTRDSNFARVGKHSPVVEIPPNAVHKNTIYSIVPL